MKKPLGASVHPFSHKLEWGGWKPVAPALRRTDYKCPYCVLIEFK